MLVPPGLPSQRATTRRCLESTTSKEKEQSHNNTDPRDKALGGFQPNEQQVDRSGLCCAPGFTLVFPCQAAGEIT